MHKKLGSFFLSLFLITGFTLAVTTGKAHAYIEIGSATLVIQALLAGLFGGLFAIKMFWRRIMDNLGRLFAKNKGANPPTE